MFVGDKVKVKVIKEIPSSRNFIPKIGSIGRIKGKTKKKLIIVEFMLPLTTSNNSIVTQKDETDTTIEFYFEEDEIELEMT